MIDTRVEGFTLRHADKNDVPLILEMIKELATYEKLAEEVEATEESLEKSLFEQKAAKVLIGEYKGKPVAFALYFYNFSTFVGKPGLYLEDVYVRKEMRGMGIGTLILSYLAKLAKEEGCERMDWIVLDWNKPSIEFYKRIGAKPQDQWRIFRVEDEAIGKLAEQFDE